jgi:hypothetical protein
MLLLTHAASKDFTCAYAYVTLSCPIMYHTQEAQLTEIKHCRLNIPQLPQLQSGHQHSIGVALGLNELTTGQSMHQRCLPHCPRPHKHDLGSTYTDSMRGKLLTNMSKHNAIIRPLVLRPHTKNLQTPIAAQVNTPSESQTKIKYSIQHSLRLH